MAPEPERRIGVAVDGSERREEKNPDRGDGNSYLFFALGIGLIAATVMIISTTGEAVTGFPFVIGAAALIGIGLSRARGRQRAVAPPADKERELLSAIRDNGGSITPAEAAMETSLTVREADKMLSELAGGGHLAVESRGGSLFYALPKRGSPEIENGN